MSCIVGRRVDVRRRPFETISRSQPSPARAPLAAGRAASSRRWATGPPLQDTGPTIVGRSVARIAATTLSLSLRIGAPDDVDRDLEERVDGAERLRPAPALASAYPPASSDADHALQRRLVRDVRGPPRLGGQVLPEVAAEGLRRRSNSRALRPSRPAGVALLRRLLVEVREVRRDRVAGDDLRVGALEPRDLRGEVVGAVLVAPRIDEPVAALRSTAGTRSSCRRTRSVAVGRPRAADGPVGRTASHMST